MQASTLLLCVYMFFVFVVLVNMLVALMADIYGRVKLDQYYV